MNEVALIAGMAAVTFGARYLPLAILRRFALPDSLRRGLAYVPPVVLMAIVAPAMLTPAGNSIDLSLSNAYLWGGALSFVIAWRSRNLLLTIVGGMALFLLWRLLF